MRARSVLLALTAVFLAVPAAAQAGGGCHAKAGLAGDATTATGTRVEVAGCSFVPTVLTVDPGATIEFDNVSGIPHTATGLGGSILGDVTFTEGVRRWTAPDEPGVYPYACLLHAGMVGAIVVGDAGADAAVAASQPAAATIADEGPATGLVVAAAALVLAVMLGGIQLLRRPRSEARR